MKATKTKKIEIPATQGRAEAIARRREEAYSRPYADRLAAAVRAARAYDECEAAFRIADAAEGGRGEVLWFAIDRRVDAESELIDCLLALDTRLALGPDGSPREGIVLWDGFRLDCGGRSYVVHPGLTGPVPIPPDRDGRFLTEGVFELAILSTDSRAFVAADG